MAVVLLAWLVGLLCGGLCVSQRPLEADAGSVAFLHTESAPLL